METIRVRVVVYSKGKIVYDDLIACKDLVTDYVREDVPVSDVNGLKLNRRGINGYLVSAYIYTMRRSDVYRKSAVKTLLEYSESKMRTRDKKLPVVRVGLRMPRLHYLDYKWNERVTQMALERRELDHAMSWLSTLGGGFSALGENFEHCVRDTEKLVVRFLLCTGASDIAKPLKSSTRAEMAGKISVRQLQLALRLGDPLLVARCKLWAALSLLQRGYLRVSRDIVRDNYRLAIIAKDIRLQNMCKGVWAKLQYTYKTKRRLNTP